MSPLKFTWKIGKDTFCGSGGSWNTDGGWVRRKWVEPGAEDFRKNVSTQFRKQCKKILQFTCHKNDCESDE